MRKNFYKPLIIFMSVLMTSSLIACGSNDAAGADRENSSSAMQSTAKQTAAPAQASRPVQTTAQQTTKADAGDATSPEVLALLEEIEPYFGSFRYEEYDSTLYGHRKIGGVIVIGIFDGVLRANVPGKNFTIPVENYKDILEKGSFTATVGSDVFSITWSEDRNTINFKRGFKNSETIASDGSAVRIRSSK